MKKVFITMLLLFSIGSLTTFAQIAIDKKLKIGDTVPDLTLKFLYNYKGKEKSLGDFRGRLLILDFWATWCGPCIAAFPKMESLRQKFKGKMEILPVTSDNDQKVKELLENLKKENGLDIYSIVNDKEIRSYFNFKSIPHYVWINPVGKYLGDSKSEEITEERIRQVLTGKMDLFSLRQTIVRRLADPKGSLFNSTVDLTENGERKMEKMDVNTILRESTFTRNINGLTSSAQFTKNRFTGINASIGSMLSYLYGNMIDDRGLYSTAFYFWSANRTLWEVENKELLKYRNKELLDLSRKNIPGWRNLLDQMSFCYELKLAKDTSIRYLAKNAIEELNSNLKAILNLHSHLEKRKVKCLVLKRTSKIDKVASSSKQASEIAERNNTQFYGMKIINKPYIHFIMPLVTLNLQLINTPIVDETGFSLDMLVDIRLEGKLHDWKIINQSLANYDMVFVEEDRVIDMLVITDRDLPTKK